MAAPLLSIAMPTRNRAQLFEGALTSLLSGTATVADLVEVTVSDGSDDDATGQVVEQLLADWPGGYRYVHNRPMLPLVDNMNRAAELASGEWVMQLDDDDYLLPGAGSAMVEAIRRAGPEEQALMFSARIVDADGVVRREQRFRRERYLEPKAALRRLLRDSSFVREPTMVVRRSALEREGRFDTTVGGVTDTDMWVRLFSHYGVRCLPQLTCAYTIHQGAATTGMWNPGTISALARVFDRAVAAGVVPEAPCGAGRPTSSISSSWPVSIAGFGSGAGPRPGRCSGCSSCRRFVALASPRSGCRCGSSSRPPPSDGSEVEPRDHRTRSSQISRQYG